MSACFNESLGLGFRADHEPGDIMQINDWDARLITQFNELGRFIRLGDENDGLRIRDDPRQVSCPMNHHLQKNRKGLSRGVDRIPWI